MGLGLIRRLWRAPARQGDAVSDVVIYEGRVHLVPSNDDGGGWITLVGKGDLVDYLYEHLEVPDEDGLQNEASFQARITVEVFPDPDMIGWP